MICSYCDTMLRNSFGEEFTLRLGRWFKGCRDCCIEWGPEIKIQNASKSAGRTLHLKQLSFLQWLWSQDRKKISPSSQKYIEIWDGPLISIASYAHLYSLMIIQTYGHINRGTQIHTWLWTMICTYKGLCLLFVRWCPNDFSTWISWNDLNCWELRKLHIFYKCLMTGMEGFNS